jgi:hypothetical protein
MAVTSFSTSTIANGQGKYNRVAGVSSNLDWCEITTTPTGNYADSGIVYNYWIFKSNSTLAVSKSGRIDFLVVAGGGTGSSDNTRDNVGGGGAGGVIQSPADQLITVGSYAITIGSGGAAQVTSNTVGNDGSNSSIGSLAVAIGGGGGGSRPLSGRNGGCGGGSGDGFEGPVNQKAGDGTFGQGFRGGNKGGDAGSGGGAGGVGTDGTVGGSTIVGGIGRTTTIIPTSVATSEAVGQVSGGVLYFAGGGGAGSSSAGGLGGGGAGSPADQRGVNCAANTGGGSGNSDTNQGTPYAGAGGSGVVILRARA